MGVVDLPVAREAATDYPVLVGSSLKGALRDKNGDRQNGRRRCSIRFSGSGGRPACCRWAVASTAGAQPDRRIPVDDLPTPNRTLPP